MTEPIRIASAHDLLALVPVLAGYRPHRSLVCLAFRGDRVAGVLRYDLPPVGADREPLVNAAVGVLCRVKAVDGLIAVTYSDRTYRARSAAGERALLRLLARRASQAGFAVRDTIRVATDGWGSLLDPETPRGGRSLALIDTSSIIRHPDVEAGLPVPLDDVTLPSVPATEAQLIRTAVRVLEAEYDDPDSQGELRRLVQTARPVDLIESLLEAPFETDLTAAEIARLAWLARLAAIPVCRDAMMLQIAFGPEAARVALAQPSAAAEPGARTAPADPTRPDGAEDGSDREQRATVTAVPVTITGEAASQVREEVALGRMLLGESRVRPDIERVRRGLAVLLRVAASAYGRQRAGLLCVASWLVWGLGRGSAAAELLDAALDAEAGYPMARLLARYFATGALPEWLFEPGERNVTPSSLDGANGAGSGLADPGCAVQRGRGQ